MNYYISDCHFFHKNILFLTNRPYNTVEEMNEDIISRWNSRITNDDDVYIIGDMFFRFDDIQQVKDVLNRLNGKKHLIKGNHDKFLKQIRWQDYFESFDLYKEIADGDRFVILFHYPIEEWNGFYRNSYMVYGHIHDNFVNVEYHPRKLNAGVEVNNYEPKTLDELIEINRLRREQNDLS